MTTNIFTNKNGNTLLEKFKGVFQYNSSIQDFDALVGYFRASGYFRIRPFLDNIPKIRILVGINVDRLIADAQQTGLEFFKNHDKAKEEFINDILKDVQNSEYDAEIEKGIIQFIEDIISKKIEVKAHPDKKLHAKVYILRPVPFNEHTHSAVITGSSNLTDAGLGAGKDHNYEFNVLLSNYSDVKFATDEFEELWNESVEILPTDLDGIKKKSHLNEDITPFELYIKMLIEYFGKRVEYDPYNIELLLPDKYHRLKYQTDAANQGYAILMKHNGFILADVVGLGKTIVACMIIKKFIYENGTHTRILIVCPPSIKNNWIRTAEDFHIRPHFEFITIGSLHKILNEDDPSFSNADQFDLIIVDESHKFRNDYTEMYIQLQEICKRQRLRPAMNGDAKKKVVLISATPLNNKPEDIENQLYLFQDRRNSTLDNIKNLQDYFKPINEKYKKLSSEKVLNKKKLKELFTQLRNDVVEPLVIRRTRRDITNNQEYLEDLNLQGIKFPEVKDPIEVFYKLDSFLSKLFFETVSLISGVDENGNISDGLGYYRYRAIEFLTKQEDRDIYGNVSHISERLSSIMRILLIKRLESSFHAFKSSLGRLQSACENMIEMFNKDSVFIAPDLDINKLLEEGYTYDEIEAKINEKGGNNKSFKPIDFDDKFLKLLKGDKKKIDDLVLRWKQIIGDPKLETFLSNMKGDFLSKKNNPSGKLVIFTESKETAFELKRNLESNGFSRILCISSDNRKESEKDIRLNFDANLEIDRWKNDYDIVVTTEVLAEGVNLHRSNIIVNYDVPWNSTRLMQRIGRVNRIGSQADQIFVFNFYPSAESDAEISLVNTALRKLQAFHIAFGEDNRIFSLMEEVGDGALYGNKIQQEESEMLRILNELREFRKNNTKWFNEISKIPNKSRVCRDDKNIDKTNLPVLENYPEYTDFKDCSVTYLKADNHPGVFCLVTGESNVFELNLIESYRLFRCNKDEKGFKPSEKHYDQVKEALKFFKEDTIQQSLSTTNRTHLSAEENKALTNINAIVKVANTDQKRIALKIAMDGIKKGVFLSRGLPKEVNTFFKSQIALLKNPDEFIETLFKEVLNKYDFGSSSSPATPQAKGIINPKIVLTLNFA